MTARKKSSRKKKAGRKKGAARKKSARKKSGRKKGGRRKKKTGGATLMGAQLPKSLAAFGRQLRRDLNALEKELETAGRDTRRSMARVMRDASHQLGVLEARGEREWRKRTKQAQRDLDRLMKRVRKAVGA